MEELVVVYAADIEVDKAIIVVVARGYPHAIALSLHARTERHIAKRAITIVAIQPVIVLGIGLLQRGDRCTVREKQVKPSVVVVIKGRHSTQHRFDGIPARTHAVQQSEIDSGTANHVFKFDEWLGRL